MAPRVLCFSGSAKRSSFNQRLATAAARRAQEAGAEVTLLDLADYPMPLYNGDLEADEGIPENVHRVRTLLLEHDAFLISCPEYNGSITPLLKNAIDWASRQRGDSPPLAAFRGKTCALLAASPGGLGGLRGLVHVRAILSGIGVLVIPDQLAVPSAHKVLGEGGAWLDEATEPRMNGVVDALLATAGKLHAG